MKTIKLIISSTLVLTLGLAPVAHSMHSSASSSNPKQQSQKVNFRKLLSGPVGALTTQLMEAQDDNDLAKATPTILLSMLQSEEFPKALTYMLRCDPIYAQCINFKSVHELLQTKTKETITADEIVALINKKNLAQSLGYELAALDNHINLTAIAQVVIAYLKGENPTEEAMLAALNSCSAIKESVALRVAINYALQYMSTTIANAQPARLAEIIDALTSAQITQLINISALQGIFSEQNAATVDQVRAIFNPALLTILEKNRFIDFPAFTALINALAQNEPITQELISQAISVDAIEKALALEEGLISASLDAATPFIVQHNKISKLLQSLSPKWTHRLQGALATAALLGLPYLVSQALCGNPETACHDALETINPTGFVAGTLATFAGIGFYKAYQQLQSPSLGTNALVTKLVRNCSNLLSKKEDTQGNHYRQMCKAYAHFIDSLNPTQRVLLAIDEQDRLRLIEQAALNPTILLDRAGFIASARLTDEQLALLTSAIDNQAELFTSWHGSFKGNAAMAELADNLTDTEKGNLSSPHILQLARANPLLLLREDEFTTHLSREKQALYNRAILEANPARLNDIR